MDTTTKTEAELKRSLSLPLVILYGLGVTVGAGIYVLIGATVGQAGMYAPLAFVLAAVVMAFSAGSMAELSSRLPVSAGEAAYVKAGFQRSWLALLTGLLVITSGLVSAATVSIGSAGYIQEILSIPETLIITLVVITMGAVAIWGIRESVTFAAIFTFIEVGALLAIVFVALWKQPELIYETPKIFPELGDFSALAAISSAGLLAFFAFIGFEDIVNLAEEAKQPRKTIPLAILVTLIGATAIYVSVATIAVLTVPLDELSASQAPVGLLFERVIDTSPLLITLVAIVATLNGVIIQMIMVSRVLYGLGKQGSIPSFFAKIHPYTQTPVIATLCVIVVILLLALVFPIGLLAEMTSSVALCIFILINLALCRIKLRGDPAPEGAVQVGLWVPILGALLSSGFLLASWFVK